MWQFQFTSYIVTEWYRTEYHSLKQSIIMKKEFVFLIALVLAIAYGQAEEVNLTSNDRSVESFSAFVGQQVSRTFTFVFNNGEIPVDPDPPVVDRSTGSDELSETFRAISSTGGYTATIVGTNSEMFSARVKNVFISLDTERVTVEVTYSPTDVGIHESILIIKDNNGSTRATRNLKGTATELIGDVNGDGVVDIEDISVVIETLLGDSYIPAADVDGDGIVTVADVSCLIDILLGVPVTRPCTFLIIEKTDGNTDEYPIDENTKVKIVKPDLVIEINGQVLTYTLTEVSRLRYDERMVTINGKLMNKYVTQADRETLKSLMP